MSVTDVAVDDKNNGNLVCSVFEYPTVPQWIHSDNETCKAKNLQQQNVICFTCKR